MPPLLEAHNLSYRINNRTLIDDISLSIQQNQMVVIIGPNGAGKSSLLKLLTGYTQPVYSSMSRLQPLICTTNNTVCGFCIN